MSKYRVIFMTKKLCISLIFSIFVVSNHTNYYIQVMHNFHANFARILEICRGFSKDLVTADSKQKNKPLNFSGLLVVVVNPQGIEP